MNYNCEYDSEYDSEYDNNCCRQEYGEYCEDCDIYYGECYNGQNHCCKCKITYDIYTLNNSPLYLTHCCKCQLIYPLSSKFIHCCKCKINYNIKFIHCCKHSFKNKKKCQNCKHIRKYKEVLNEILYYPKLGIKYFEAKNEFYENV